MPEEDMDKVIGIIKNVFQEEITKEDIDGEANLIELGVVDSFGLIEMVSQLEKTFSITFDDEDLLSSDLICLNGIVRLIESKRS